MKRLVKGIIGAVIAFGTRAVIWFMPLSDKIMTVQNKQLAAQGIEEINKISPFAISTTLVNSPLFWTVLIAVAGFLIGFFWKLLRAGLRIVLIAVCLAILAGGFYFMFL